MSLDITPGRPLRAYQPDGKFRDFSTDELVGRKLNYYEGWKCGVGVQNIHINMDGDIYGASCKVGGKLGNVFEDFTIPSEWLPCTRKVCSCGADLFVPKVKDDADRTLLRKSQALPTQMENKLDELQTEHVALERTHASEYKQVYWEIGRRCNYDCSYCWPWIHNNTESHKTLEQLMKATHLVEERFIRGAKVNWVISGGEPTINPAFLDWVRYIASCEHHLSMHSNGSRLPEYYRELITYGDLNLSVHFQFWKKERFLENVRAITEEKVSRKNHGVGHFEVKIMMTPGRRQETLDLEAELRKVPGFVDYCTWAVVPIRDGKMGDQIMEGYEPADFELFGDRR